ncbi:MAG: hypothetical protein KBC64_07025, partial [Simkaniaceae bacterium]|nr:hypothetical protein [Simkaniaceae bacterium]
MRYVFVSNRFEELLAALEGQLFGEKSSLFGQKFLILPTLGLKSPIYFELLKNRSVVAGIQALELGSAIRHFAHLNIPTSSLLSLKLENLLVK